MVNYENIDLLEVVQKVSENPHRTLPHNVEKIPYKVPIVYSPLFSATCFKPLVLAFKDFFT